MTHQDTNALSAALKITYLSTQGILQAKHDPVQAQRLYEHVNDSVRNQKYSDVPLPSDITYGIRQTDGMPEYPLAPPAYQ